MKAWQITATEELQLIERVQEAEPGDVKVRISKAALSSTDLAIFRGKNPVFPIIPVRSAIGLVSESHELSGLKKGERVVINPYILSEPSLRNKDKPLVADVKVMGVDCDGLICDFISLPPANVCLLPEGICDEEAIFVEQIAMAIKTFDVLETEKGNYLAILGARTLGNIIAQLALYYQLVPIVIDTDNDNLLLAEKHGIYYTINPAECDLRQRIMEITGGKMTEYTVYEARSDISTNYIPLITQECGRVAIVGYNHFLDKLNLNLGDTLLKQLTMTCIRNGYGEIYTAINLLANKVIDTTDFIDKVIPFIQFSTVV
ncbi:MAG: zinc-binding dehydrogenase, partial [Clostridia bacterium]